MKKAIISCALFLMLVSGAGQLNAMSGIGLYGNLMGNGTGTGGGAGLTLRCGSFPVIGLEWNFMPHASVLGGSLDGWLVNQLLAERLSYYMGIGAYAAATGTSNPSVFTFGGRIPIGLQLFPVDPLEIFLELSPMIVFLPAIDWTVSVRLGFRILY
jgi:hypothetical protein